jgi:hypothetical protein
MSDTIYSPDTSEPAPANVIEGSMQSRGEWKAYAEAQAGKDASELTLDQAARETTRRRKERGDVEEPIVARKYDHRERQAPLIS